MLFFLAGADSFDPLHVEGGFLFWSTITFAIVLFILYKVGWGPLSQAIEERESKVKGDIDAAEAARRDAEAAMAEHKAQLDAAAAEAKKVLDEAREAAERAQQNILAEAKAQADSLRIQAEKDIATARDKAVADIKNQVVDVALAISKRVVSKAVDQAEHSRLADEVLARSGDLS